jgi:hypothetical protein
MDVTHSTTARNAATDAVVTQLGASPSLVFRVGGTIGSPGAIAATLVMSATPFAAASGGTATANAITSDTNAAGQGSAVSKASLQTSGGTLHIYCDVAASASDINMTNGLTISAGDTVSCSSLTYTALSA